MANTQYVGKHFQSFAETIAKTFMVGQIFNRTSQNCRTKTFLGKRNQKQKFCGYLLVKRPGLPFYGGEVEGGGGAQGKQNNKNRGLNMMQIRGKLCQYSHFKSG